VYESYNHSSSDGGTWNYAGENKHTLVSKGEDFLYLVPRPEAGARRLGSAWGTAVPRF